MPKHRADNVYGFAMCADGRVVFLPPRVTRYLQVKDAEEGDDIVVTVRDASVVRTPPNTSLRTPLRAVRVVRVERWEEE